MSKQQGKPNIADDAARARKLLDKHAPTKVSGLNKGNFNLQQGVNQNLGEHAVIVIISEQTVHQYTISRPIGVTDGDEKQDWVINSTEYLPSMIARKADPAQGALNQLRSQLRTQLAVDHHLLVLKEIDGKHVHFYPNRVDMPRNDVLQEARDRLKGDQAVLRNNIEQETDQAEKAKYKSQLAQLTDPTKYLDSATAASEENLRKFWQSDEVQAYLEFEAPQLYRTLTGPYADQPQVIIDGAKGKSLDTVVNAISAKIAKVSIAPAKPGAVTGLAATQPGTSTGDTVPVTGSVAPDATAKKKNLRDSITSLVRKITSPPDVATASTGSSSDGTPTKGGSGTPAPPSVTPPIPPKGGKGGAKSGGT
jgi:hypothetical protein